jgi:hypothetical protein
MSRAQWQGSCSLASRPPGSGLRTDAGLNRSLPPGRPGACCGDRRRVPAGPAYIRWERPVHRGGGPASRRSSPATAGWRSSFRATLPSAAANRRRKSLRRRVRLPSPILTAGRACGRITLPRGPRRCAPWPTRRPTRSGGLGDYGESTSPSGRLNRQNSRMTSQGGYGESHVHSRDQPG